MESISVKQASEKWGINERRVRFLAKNGRIKGAKLVKHSWVIPADATKPNIKDFMESFEQLKYPHFRFSDGKGKFGPFGGQFMPESFKTFFEPILKKFKEMIEEEAFKEKAASFLKETPLYVPKKFNETLGGVKVIIKREDLNVTGSLFVNQVLPLAMLAKRLGKEKLTVAAGNANYAMATAYVCHELNLPCRIFIPYTDYKKQKEAFDKIHMYDPGFLYICEYDGSLFNATNYGFRAFFLNDAKDLYCFHDAVGPAPFPEIVEYSQSVIGHATRRQLKEMGIDRVNVIVAPANVASNALGIFATFQRTKTRFVVVESSTSNSVMRDGHICAVAGFRTKTFVQKGVGKFSGVTTCSATSYPALAPQIAYRVSQRLYDPAWVTDEEAMQACKEFYELEGIFPSFEDGYSLAYIKKTAKRMKEGNILMCFTGSGEKDKNYILEMLDNTQNIDNK